MSLRDIHHQLRKSRKLVKKTLITPARLNGQVTAVHFYFPWILQKELIANL